MDCDFLGKDKHNVPSKGEDCYKICSVTFKTPMDRCTHFTWTDYNGGTCWLKFDPGFRKSNAVYRPGAVCGHVVCPSGC